MAVDAQFAQGEELNQFDFPVLSGFKTPLTKRCKMTPLRI